MPHSPALSAKIVELQRHLTIDNTDVLMSSLRAMGPLCLFDDCENEEQAKGAILVIDWLLGPLVP